MRIPILNSRQFWECPNCDITDVTYKAQPNGRFHNCSGLKGLTAPMVPKGTHCKVEAVEREDYIGKETVTLDGENRPIMRVETTRDDGNDVAVFAPCASTSMEIS